jgi:glycerophosphoryl diester phosphodiesterase
MDTMPNSRESLVTAFISGADIVEVDIRATKDGIVVLSHDESIWIPESGKARLADLSWEEIGHRSSDSGPALLRLESFLDIAEQFDRTKMLNLDIKDTSALSPAAAIVKAREKSSSVIFSGLDGKGILEARERLPGLAYFFNADEFMPLSGATREDMRKTCTLASECGCRGINLEWTRASAAFVAFAREKGLLVMLWTVDDEESMRTALEYRPDSVTTNYPDQLARLMM